ncbi:type II toxin-antitoxin system RelE/ParE family toxin [Pseudomonas nabeulensis]|uniref:Type II toxin-antitoxin system RelE/ParE family toxin n=1 Tax=Pseudomonas nabeulensis TaxID=2293833 RepID=A0A4Z0AW55_9PSED|nr:type II toxin-antitoxin system RelE/ParE family toxin [Pseudomonas nabeulensis]TFY91032.1 type II toxin-antitoxin system RelE/ParE family toxin [Pseudomonas nabeulensis]
MNDIQPVLNVVFYRTETGNEPVREWLMDLPREDRKLIGIDIKSVQFGWPYGMPLVRKLEHRLWETRTLLGSNIARVIFTLVECEMVLLHGFIKKSQKTPKVELDTARRRKSKL